MVPFRGESCLASRSVLASTVTPPPTLGEGGRLPKHWLEDTWNLSAWNLSEAMC